MTAVICYLPNMTIRPDNADTVLNGLRRRNQMRSVSSKYVRFITVLNFLSCVTINAICTPIIAKIPMKDTHS